MIDIKKVKEQAEAEFRAEKEEAAKEKLKTLLRKRDQAQKVLDNINREIADAYADLG